MPLLSMVENCQQVGEKLAARLKKKKCLWHVAHNSIVQQNIGQILAEFTALIDYKAEFVQLLMDTTCHQHAQLSWAFSQFVNFLQKQLQIAEQTEQSGKVRLTEYFLLISNSLSAPKRFGLPHFWCRMEQPEA
jgi:hypothetical protein